MARGRQLTVTFWGLAAVLASTVAPAVLTATAAPAGATAAEHVTEVEAIDGRSCAITSLGRLLCWGHNTDSQLGDGGTTDSLDPVEPTTAVTPLAGQTVAQVTGGKYHTCALTGAGAVACWGDDAFRQLGNGAGGSSSIPTAVVTTGPLSGRTVTQIESQYLHTCALSSDSSIACWGNNGSGRLGDGTTTAAAAPVAVTVAGTPLAGKTIAEIGVGQSFSCALATDSTLACWGDNSLRQLGNGTTTASSVPTAVTIAGTPLAGKTITHLAVGSASACALASDSTLACWGYNGSGGIGNGTTTNASTPVAVTTAGTPLAGATISSITGGGGHACARTAGGTLACWGANSSGAAGNGGTATTKVPTAVSVAGTPLQGAQVSQVSAGFGHVCALTTTGVVACWGVNAYGQVGDGHEGRSRVPTSAVAGVLSGATVTQIDSGGDHSCALTSAGAVACWGEGQFGQLGTGTTAPSALPAWVTTAGTALAGRTVTKLALGGSNSCAILDDGSMACWGYSYGSKAVAISTVGTPLEGKAISTMATGSGHRCAVSTDHVLACWGTNTYGELGTGTTTTSSKPVAVVTAGTPLAGKTVVGVGVGTDSSCAVTSDSVLACWGEGGANMLGNDSTADHSLPVAATITGTPFAGKTIVEVEGGDSSTMCARTSDGTVGCWGLNGYGESGDGTPGSRTHAVALATAGTPLAGKAIAQVEVGYIHVCARATDSTLACWGSNSLGQLGNGTTEQANAPTGVITAGTPLAGKAIAQISRGMHSGCALTTDSVISCWGQNWDGQFGNGTVGFVSVPTEALGLPHDTVATAPGAPTGVTGTAGNATVDLSWVAPASDGGSAITGYSITPYIGAAAQAPISSTGSGTSKQITGLVNGTGYTFTVAAVNGVGTGAASAASAVLTPVAPLPGYHPFASWTAFVARQHQDVLGRAPTAPESSTWVAALTGGSKVKGDLVDELRRSTENTTNVDPTARLYRAFLGRAPDAGGLKFWIGRRRSGNWSLTKMADSFASSNEFKRKYGTLTNRQFVTRIYTDVLGRTADQAGVDYWTKKLDTKSRTRGGVMVGFSESNEYKRKQAENTDVSVGYIFLLGRVPTAPESTDWVTRQKAGTTHVTLLGELLGSAGYATHITG